jgi:hypothetical protein
LYRLDVNHFRGEESAQLIVERILAGPGSKGLV